MNKTAAIVILWVVLACPLCLAQYDENADNTQGVANTPNVDNTQSADNTPSADSTQNVQNAEPILSVSAEGTSISAEGNVNLDFKDAELHNVLRVLSHKSGVNIVAGPEVKGLVTIQLKDVPWKRALEVILETYGYGYQQKDNIIIVTTIENLKKRREDAMVLAEQ